MRVGPWFEPLRKSRSPLTLAIHERRRTCRSPVRRWRASDAAPPSLGVEHHARRGGRAASASPSARGHQRSGSLDRHRPLEVVGAGGERLVGDVVDAAERAVHRHRAGRVAVERGAQHEHRALGRGLAAEGAQPRDAHRTGLEHAARVARCRPGFQSGSRQSQCWNTPVRFRLAVRSSARDAGDLDGEVVLAAGAQRVGDLEGVRGEVALGVAEVRPVEPHVALVEEAVEGQPGAATLGRAHRVEGPPVEQRSVGVGEGGGRAPVAGDLDGLPARRRRSRRRATCGGGRRRRRRRATSPRARPWSSEGTGIARPLRWR